MRKDGVAKQGLSSFFIFVKEKITEKRKKGKERRELQRNCRKQGCRRNEAEIHSLRRPGFRDKNKSSVNIPEPQVEVSC